MTDQIFLPTNCRILNPDSKTCGECLDGYHQSSAANDKCEVNWETALALSFGLIDTNKDGYNDFSEILGVSKFLDLNMGKDESEDMLHESFVAMDYNKDMKIDWNEFYTFHIARPETLAHS
jgi:Ca2+-binding EF-hand superfamily protein